MNEQRANPGGQLDPKNIIGRERLIENLWDALELQSVRMTAERRIGKTSVMSKMEAEPRTGWRPVYMDLEKLHTPMEFALAIYGEVEKFLTTKKKAIRKAKEIYQHLEGAEVSGVFRLPEGKEKEWKAILTSSLEDLVANFEKSDERLLFFWDEMPYLLEHIRDREGPEVALELLDVLREQRKAHSEVLRMVITGSIGIHHVLKTLKKTSKHVLNDVLQFEVHPLAMDAAKELGARLIRGERLNCSDEERATTTLAEECDCFAFYIHHVMKELKLTDQEVSDETVKGVVAKQLADDNDPWELYHFSERLEEYYGDEEPVVKLILDELSLSSNGHPDELLERLKGQSVFDDRERLLELLRLLVQDHYLIKGEDGRYEFRFSLIQRWWKQHRHLG